LDISVRNARSTAAPHKRDLESIVVGPSAIVKRYFDWSPNMPGRAGAGGEIQLVEIENSASKTAK